MLNLTRNLKDRPEDQRRWLYNDILIKQQIISINLFLPKNSKHDLAREGS